MFHSIFPVKLDLRLTWTNPDIWLSKTFEPANQLKDKELSQNDIALHLDLSKSYIGHIESPNFIAKYNTGHLNELAKLFKCSPKDFLPEKAL